MRFLTLALLLTLHIIGNAAVDVNGAAAGGAGSQIAGRSVSFAAPSDTNVITWNATTSRWEPAAASGGGMTNPMTTAGDTIVGGVAGAPARLAAGATSGHVLTSNGSGVAPSWQSVNSVISSGDLQNCGVTATVASSALTIALVDGGGSALSASSPCIISFRNATATSGTYSRVTTTAASAGVNTVVVSNGSSLGCTVSVPCMLFVYAINNAGTVNIAVVHGGQLDEGSVQTSVAEGGAGAADSNDVLYSTSALSSKAVRLIARINITPAAAFAWTNSVTEISHPPFFRNPWIILAKVAGSAVTFSTSGTVGSYTELINASLTLTPLAQSAPVGTMCSTTNAATAPSLGATTCAAGSESIGINFAIPAPGIYEVCFSAGFYERLASGVRAQPTFELIETPTNAQTLTYESNNAVGYVMAGSGGVDTDISANLASCGIFPWIDVAAGTVKGVRLMYQQVATGTITTNGVLLDSASGRQGFWSARRLQ